VHRNSSPGQIALARSTARMDAGIDGPLIYASIAAGFAVAYPFAFLANRYLIARGKGHSPVHEYHGH
jgi:hypothetical protein